MKFIDDPEIVFKSTEDYQKFVEAVKFWFTTKVVPANHVMRNYIADLAEDIRQMSWNQYYRTETIGLGPSPYYSFPGFNFPVYFYWRYNDPRYREALRLGHYSTFTYTDNDIAKVYGRPNIIVRLALYFCG